MDGAQKPKKGFIIVLDGELKNTEIEILYFPPEYSLEKSNSFSEVSIPGLESSYLQFVKGNSASITLEVFFDTYEKKDPDVRKFTDKLTNLMNLDPALHAPPPLSFIWGHPTEPFNCVIEKVTKKFTMFNKDGVPVRAKLSVTLKEFKISLSVREKALQSPDKTRVRLFRQGDSLWMIAKEEYGNPSLWRPIAVKNNIDNPRLIRPGFELVIPSLE